MHIKIYITDLVVIFAEKSCGDGWYRFEKKCYRYALNIGSMSQKEAIFVCEKMYNGHLAIIQTEEEQHFINLFLILMRDKIYSGNSGRCHEYKNFYIHLYTVDSPFIEQVLKTKTHIHGHCCLG